MIENFPSGFSPKTGQASLIDKVDAAFKSDKRFVIIQAPTGTGKSIVSKTIGNSSREASPDYIDLVDTGDIYKHGPNGYIHKKDVYATNGHGCTVLTTTKQLQNQYSELFPDTTDLKGKHNYDCALDENFEVDTAPCNYLPDQLRKCKLEKCCKYYNARDEALKGQFSTMSYSKFLTMDDIHKHRQYIVCDEASELEDALVREYTVEINYKSLKAYGAKFKYSVRKEKVYESLSDVYVTIGDYIKERKQYMLRNKNKESNRKVSNEIQKASMLHKRIKTLTHTFKDCKYLVKQNIHGVTFTPLRVDKLSSNIFDHAEKIVLMSATIVDINSFTRSLGINQDEYVYIDHQSNFNPRQSPILIFPNQPLNNGNLEMMLKTRLIKHIEGILDHHSDDKGIIHTHSSKITEMIYKNIGHKYKQRLLTRLPGMKDNEAIIEEHYNSPTPTVLMSPSLTFGVDLKDDRGRFGIVVKLPYLPMMEERIKILMKESPKWYTMKMLTTLVQACGRTTRNEEDSSLTYIMDSNLLKVIDRYRSYLPKHFLDRCENR